MLLCPGRQALFESFLLGNFHLPLNLLHVSASMTINQAQVACPHGHFYCLKMREANAEEEMDSGKHVSSANM